MPQYNEKFVTGQLYHVYNRSIANYIIFNDDSEFSRMTKALRYYQFNARTLQLSKFIRLSKTKREGFTTSLNDLNPNGEKLVEIIAFCLMPTHYHLTLQQLADSGISKYISNVQNSYTRYFNTRHRRKGPLWEGKAKRVLVKTDDQLMQLTRYIHLNPTTSYLTENPERWQFSSYNEYISKDIQYPICNSSKLLDISPDKYKTFTEDRISYQRGLAEIKKLLID